uniref:SAV_6107 family HEPN domain-containing protein n=1 Tax=Actinotalea sp. TaxID=1872145 RepID=UPI0035638687
VDRLLERSDAELVAATFSAEPAERFVHAHLAALRAGAALVEAHAAVGGGRPSHRGRPRPVWELVAALEPGLLRWTALFAAAAPLRAALETGRAEVGDERADLALASAEEFQDEVRAVLARGVEASSQGARGALRAS